MQSSPDITPSTVFRHRGDVRYRIIDEEAVVVRQEAGEVLGLNETAARLLSLIDAKCTVSDLIDAMAEEFAIERLDLERDVMKFVEELLDAGLIEETKIAE